MTVSKPQKCEEFNLLPKKRKLLLTTRNFADLQKQLENQSGTSNLAKYKVYLILIKYSNVVIYI